MLLKSDKFEHLTWLSNNVKAMALEGGLCLIACWRMLFVRKQSAPTVHSIHEARANTLDATVEYHIWYVSHGRLSRPGPSPGPREQRVVLRVRLRHSTNRSISDIDLATRSYQRLVPLLSYCFWEWIVGLLANWPFGILSMK